MGQLLADFDLRDVSLPAACVLSLDAPVLDMGERLDTLLGEPDNAEKKSRSRDKFTLLCGEFEDNFGLSPSRYSLMDQFPEIEAFLDTLPGRVVRAHISRLAAGDAVRLHQDGWGTRGRERPGLPFFVRTFRLHLPLVTSPNNYVCVARRLYHVRPGEVFYFNNLLEHAAFNCDPAIDRSHLIIDVQPDDELRDLVATGATPKPAPEALHAELGLITSDGRAPR